MGATDDENKSALGESGAKSPEMGRVVAEKAPHVEAGALARRDPALRSIVVPVSCSGSYKIWAELNEPRTVDSAEESVLSEVFNKCVIRSVEAVKKRQEDNMSLRDGEVPLAGGPCLVDALAPHVWLIVGGNVLPWAREMRHNRVGKLDDLLMSCPGHRALRGENGWAGRRRRYYWLVGRERGGGGRGRGL